MDLNETRGGVQKESEATGKSDGRKNKGGSLGSDEE